MRRNNSIESRLVERSKDKPVADSQLADVATVLALKVAGTSSDTASRETEIRELAFSLYEQRGRREGHEFEDWLEAEEIILTQAKPAA